MDTGSPPAPASVPSRLRRTAGFSLVEVVLAIGIVSFAFVALLGLLPAGLSTFRTAIDTSNEARILQSITGKAQLTDFSKLPELDYTSQKEIFYYDEEGSQTDTSVSEIPDLKSQRLYEAKIFVKKASEKKADDYDLTRDLGFSTTLMVVFANMASPAAREFDTIESVDDLETLLNKQKGRTNVHIRTMLISKMDGVPHAD